jgi:parvulin-like peptidyl-prolyl isomerase
VKLLRPFFALAVGAGLLLGLAGCNAASPYAVTVNGTTISRAQLDSELNNAAHSPAYLQSLQSQGVQVQGTAPGTFNQNFVALMLNELIRYALIRQQLAGRHQLPTTDELAKARDVASQQVFVDQQSGKSYFPQFSAGYQTTLTARQAQYQKLVTTLGTDPADQDYYNSHKGQFATEVCVRHILLAQKGAKGGVDFPASFTLANQVRSQLVGGDSNFVALAKQYSQDNQGSGSSAANGGQLAGSAADGCLSASDLNQLIAPFVRAIASLPVGQVSTPVQTQFGYHLIEVTSRQIPPYGPSMKSSVSRSIFLNFLQTAVSGARVKLNPQFGTLDRNNPNSGPVIPPSGPKLPVAASTTTTLAP